MLSWVAIERTVEEQMNSDPEIRRRVAGRPLRSHGRALSDEDLLAKLRECGIQADRAWLGQRIESALSAQQIVESAPCAAPIETKFGSDWIWICVSVLWERWFPSIPSFETLDDRIAEGYEFAKSREPVAACERWLDAWKDVKSLLSKAKLRSLEELDKRFQGSQYLTNWIQDLEDELWAAAPHDRQYLGIRIEFCEETLAMFGHGDSLTVENRKRALAETYFEAGDPDKAEALFRQWLDADPRWGWGWIGWSDCFRFLRAEAQDLGRCEKILRDALAVPNLRDRADVLDRMGDLLDEQGRAEEAEEFWDELKAPPDGVFNRIESSANQTRQAQLVPVSRPKIGRNEPCPCGSGKKYKKCCGVE